MRSAKPMLATTPSIVITFARSIDGWKCQIGAPLSRSRAYRRLPASCTNRLSAGGPGKRISTCTPTRRRRAPSESPWTPAAAGRGSGRPPPRGEMPARAQLAGGPVDQGLLATGRSASRTAASTMMPSDCDVRPGEEESRGGAADQHPDDDAEDPLAGAPLRTRAPAALDRAGPGDPQPGAAQTGSGEHRRQDLSLRGRRHLQPPGR